MEIKIIEGNKLIAEFIGHLPTVEWCVADMEADSICYSPANVGNYFPHPLSQHAECERWLKEQYQHFPGGWVAKGNYKPTMFEYWPNYNSDWNRLMTVIDRISKMPLLNADGTECTDPVDTCYPITFNMPTDDGMHVMFRFKGFAIYTADTLIEAAWLACVDACKFNTQPF